MIQIKTSKPIFFPFAHTLAIQHFNDICGCCRWQHCPEMTTAFSFLLVFFEIPVFAALDIVLW